MTDGFRLLGRGALFSAPFRNSISSWVAQRALHTRPKDKDGGHCLAHEPPPVVALAGRTRFAHLRQIDDSSSPTGGLLPSGRDLPLTPAVLGITLVPKTSLGTAACTLQSSDLSPSCHLTTRPRD